MLERLINNPKCQSVYRRAIPGAIVAVGLLAAGCSGGPEPTGVASNGAVPDYRLGSGDKVAINVFGDESLSGEQTLDGAGSLTMPLIGNVEAKGLTSNGLQSKLESKLTKYMRDPEVTVRVVEYRPFYIIGEVREPGSYSYVDGMTVVNAVALAGGYTYRARQEDYVLQRGGKTLSAENMTPIVPGDIITVRERYF